MTLIPTLNAPTTGDPRVPAPLVENDNTIRTVVNGSLDTTNLSASAGILGTQLSAAAAIADTQLASPNNSVYRTLTFGASTAEASLAAGTYILGTRVAGAPLASGGDLTTPADGAISSSFIYFDDADYTVAGRTQKLRLRAQVNANATAWSSVTATFGLYPVTFAGAANVLTATLGTVVSGSTVAIANPSASSVNQGNSGDFTIPSDGQYCLGVVTNATLTANAAALLTAQLQTRNV